MIFADEIITEFNRNHTFNSNDCLFIRRLREVEFSNIQIAAVINILDETCPSCFDSPIGCHCWDDS